jgi:hypothetical protein
MKNEKLIQPVHQVLSLLVAGKYAELEALTKADRLNASEIAKTINDYGRKLVLPSDDAFQMMNVIEVRNAKPAQWSIIMPLWTREEGRSDLSIELMLTENRNDFAVQLNNIHVL